MTTDLLRSRIVEEFESANLLSSLNLDGSAFRELPRVFEASHLSIRLVVTNLAAMAEAIRIAAKLKLELQHQDVELEYAICAQWKVSSFSANTLQRRREGGWKPAANFHVELQSGAAKRLATVHISPESEPHICRYLRAMPVDEQHNALETLLESCLNQQLAGSGAEYWDPILYPSHSIEADEIAGAISRVEAEKRELQPQLE